MKQAFGIVVITVENEKNKKKANQMKTLALSLLFCLAGFASAQDFTTNHGPSVGYENIHNHKEPNKERRHDRDHSHPPALPLKKTYPPLFSHIKRGSKKGFEGMELVSSVKKVGDKWEYTYVLKNIGKRKTWMVGSSLPDRAIGLSSGIRDVAHFYRLKPGKSITITVTHKDPPVEYQAVIQCFDKDRHSGFKDWYKENGVKITGVQPTYYFQMAGGVNGWLPKGLQPRQLPKKLTPLGPLPGGKK